MGKIYTLIVVIDLPLFFIHTKSLITTAGTIRMSTHTQTQTCPYTLQKHTQARTHKHTHFTTCSTTYTKRKHTISVKLQFYC